MKPYIQPYWMAREHIVFDCGDPVGKTLIHPTVGKIMESRRINAYINESASERRWEAQGGGCIAFADDPNIAVLDCAFQMRLAAPRRP